MDVRDAASLLAPVRPRLHSPGPWVDLGCGDGTFTAALAEQLPSRSTIEAVDRDADALRRVPPLHAGIVIRTTQCDFDARPLPWSGLAGVLMANALHFVAGQKRCSSTWPHRCGRAGTCSSSNTIRRRRKEDGCRTL